MKKLVLAAFLAMVGTASSAATILVSGGILTGAEDVNVDGTLYDVSFVGGTCASAFDGCDDASDFSFADRIEATVAAEALRDQVFLNFGIGGSFDTDPSKTIECETSSSICVTLIATSAFLSSGGVAAVSFTNINGVDTIANTNFSDTADTNTVSFLNLAVFSQSGTVSAVPLPAAGPALLLALGGLIGLRRRKG